MSWITSREALVAKTLSEVMKGVLYVRPNLQLQFDRASPFTLGKNLTTRLNNEIIKLEREVHDLTIELKAAEERAVKKKEEEVASQTAKGIASIQINELKLKLIQMQLELKQALAPRQDLELRIVQLEAEQMEAQFTITELNRLTVRQHQQLIELLGADFDHL
jgi:chromosome segregation ATPase